MDDFSGAHFFFYTIFVQDQQCFIKVAKGSCKQLKIVPSSVICSATETERQERLWQRFLKDLKKIDHLNMILDLYIKTQSIFVLIFYLKNKACDFYNVAENIKTMT